MNNTNILLEPDEVSQVLQDHYDHANGIKASFDTLNEETPPTRARCAQARMHEIVSIARELGLNINTRPPDQRE